MTKKSVSRRDFIKTTGALAGGATILGLTVGPSIFQAGSNSENAPNAVSAPAIPVAEAQTTTTTTTYEPKKRRYYLYSTDGIINVPTDILPSAQASRKVYIFGFAKPVSDTRGIGSTTALSLDPTASNFAFEDLFWQSTTTNEPFMLGKASLTAPPIWGVEGDILEITLFNLGFKYVNIPDPHTIHLHGVHAPTYFDGIPELSFGVPMWWMFGSSPPALNTTDDVKKYAFTYKMYCERPGTYMYHCHVEASEHVQMGMYGPLWIYPKELGYTWTSGSNRGGFAYGNPLTRFSQEAIMLFSEIDTRWHDKIFNPNLPTPGPDPLFANFNPVDYRPDYWFVNGRCFPDTVLPGKYTQGYRKGTATTADTVLTYYEGESFAQAPWTPAGVTVTPGGPIFAPRQPVQTYVQTGVNEKVLVRMINLGYQVQPLHFHGVMPRVVGKDTHALLPTSNPMFSTPNDQTMRIFTQCICSGETYDLIATYPDKAKLSPIYASVLATSNPNPFPPASPIWGTMLPSIDPTIPATNGILHDSYPLLYLWHIHDDYKVTNNGVYPGGATTLVKVDKVAPIPKRSTIVYLIDP